MKLILQITLVLIGVGFLLVVKQLSAITDWINAITDLLQYLGERVNELEDKQEPCEDCISREQAKAEIRKAFPALADRVDINSILNELPSVNQD